MTLLGLIRHGPTSWNESKKIQGWSDISLSPRGQETVKNWIIPEKFKNFLWVSSPLKRCLETASLLGIEPLIVPNLKEMSWGIYEGHTLQELRNNLDPTIHEREKLGLDFHPPQGETPRELQNRLKPWLYSLGQSKKNTIAVTHRGVIRNIMALATGWDMIGKPPFPIEPNCLHLFKINHDGIPAIETMNIMLK
ncbi:MAG: histidine phosphatase family protein [Alphaproteobacteria bacterium]|nr:histidine phosphatase family protein [Alphaproteobacteria bacterium]